MQIQMHHVAMVCRDVRATEAFYCRYLGFRRVRTSKAGQPDEFYMIRHGDFCLELFPMANGSQAAGVPQAGGGPNGEPEGPRLGIKHLCFQVDDVDAWYAWLAGVVEFIDPPRNSTITPWLRLAFFKDPDGNVIEIQQGWKDTE